MADCLRPLLVLLTLLDLGFVQATGIVSWTGLAPLWLLSLGATWLRQLQRHLAYRIAWNGGVLVVFALLLHHALTTGLLHMLEDGLLLAVLCQVHLLNNIGERQRPDLLFFNSFLIAFVTSVFAPDLGWSVLFTAHALVLLPALQVHVLARRGCAVTRGWLLTLWRDSLSRAAVLAVCTAAGFALLPRDFQRRGWLGDTLALPGTATTGLADRIRLDNERPLQLGDRIVLRITALGDGAQPVPSHWRGICFATFDGSTWVPQDASLLGSRFGTDPLWNTGPDGRWRRGTDFAGSEFSVQSYAERDARLCLPAGATAVQLVAPADGVLLDPRSYGGFDCLRLGDDDPGGLRYTVRLGSLPAAPPPRRLREAFLQLPTAGLPRAIVDLAAQLRGQLPPDAAAAELAEHCCRWLQSNRRYQVPGGTGFANSFDEFLLGTGAAHCEYFATALALLLRQNGVPCRLVGGYLVQERDPSTGAALARSRDAHAWVEAWLPNGRWLELDPTPAADALQDRRDPEGFWAATGARLEAGWSAVVGFDGGHRERLLAGLLAAARSLAENPISWLGVAATALAPLAWLVYRRRRRHQRLPSIVAWHAAVRAAGLAMHPGETPRELVARATAAAVPPAVLRRLSDAARNHELRRYAAAAATEP